MQFPKTHMARDPERDFSAVGTFAPSVVMRASCFRVHRSF